MDEDEVRATDTCVPWPTCYTPWGTAHTLPSHSRAQRIKDDRDFDKAYAAMKGNEKNAPFLSMLAPELRNKIYEYCFADTTKEKAVKITDFATAAPDSSLTKVCRQTRSDTLKIYKHHLSKFRLEHTIRVELDVTDSQAPFTHVKFNALVASRKLPRELFQNEVEFRLVNRDIFDVVFTITSLTDGSNWGTKVTATPTSNSPQVFPTSSQQTDVLVQKLGAMRPQGWSIVGGVKVEPMVDAILKLCQEEGYWLSPSWWS